MNAEPKTFIELYKFLQTYNGCIKEWLKKNR